MTHAGPAEDAHVSIVVRCSVCVNIYKFKPFTIAFFSESDILFTCSLTVFDAPVVDWSEAGGVQTTVTENEGYRNRSYRKGTKELLREGFAPRHRARVCQRNLVLLSRLLKTGNGFERDQ